MKGKIARGLEWLRTGFIAMLRLHPVETALVVYASAGCVLAQELDWDHARVRLMVVPLFFVLALAVNNLAGRGPWRRVYWVCWTPMVPLSLWSGLEAWLLTHSAGITFGVLLPLVLLLCRRAVANDRFVGDAIVWLRSALLALLFANVALGLFFAIFFSTVYIFGLEGAWIEHVWIDTLILCETFAVPVLFLMMADRWAGGILRGARMLEVLLNYIVSPALAIYAAIFYLYMAKIVATWTLPEGGVAYLVFGFTLAALAVKALQFLLQKRPFDWFYDRLGWVALPMQVLFWIGVMRRTHEYGLTQPRVFLLVCGGLMTLGVVLFLTRRTGRYFYLCLAGLLAFTAVAYVPGLSPRQLSERSQTRRVVRMARQLGRLDGEGRLLLTPVPITDTAHWEQYHRLYESLRYLYRFDDSTSLQTLGIRRPQQFLEAFPKPLDRWVESGYRTDYAVPGWISIDRTQPLRAALDGAYIEMYAQLRKYGEERDYSFQDDTLRLYLGHAEPVLSIPGPELLHRQLERSGYDPASGDPTEEQKNAMLDYRDRACRILFSDWSISTADPEPRLDDVNILLVMTR